MMPDLRDWHRPPPQDDWNDRIRVVDMRDPVAIAAARDQVRAFLSGDDDAPPARS